MSIKVNHTKAGFFSCCTVRLSLIINYTNNKLKLPNEIDCSNTFNRYKVNKTNDITYDFFEKYENIITNNFNFNDKIIFNSMTQFTNYTHIDFNNISPFVKKYFTPSNQVRVIIEDIEQKYNLKYDNICVLYYRGTDKKQETTKCNYDDYLIYVNEILKKHIDIQFLLQSDEQNFIEFMIKKLPNNTFHFNDEIKDTEKNSISFAQKFLSIIQIMSKCKFIICGSGNCDLWTILYRGNMNNVFQSLNYGWYTDQVNSDISLENFNIEDNNNPVIGINLHKLRSKFKKNKKIKKLQKMKKNRKKGKGS